ncbi:MAG TPA: glycoside hydrolase family 32 protein [Capsulimonadaceae bacterium]|jgi:beta-fructofuranosidase
MSTNGPSSDKIQELCDQSRLLREVHLNNPYRPGYHFVVPEGVAAPADPNGAIFWNGRYHLFYIYQQDTKHYWGHISSIDLLHWRFHPAALGPGDGDDGIFSGGAFIDRDGVATITYWGLRPTGDGICIARSTDPMLDKWTKEPANPVIASTQWGLAEAEVDGKPVVYGTADPSQIWEHDGHYYLVTGNLLVLKEYGEKRKVDEHLGDTVYLFRSDDLVHWTYLHPFYRSRREWTRDFEDNMCPDFFPLPSSASGGPASAKHMMLFISHTLGCQYYIGDYANNQFAPENHGRFTHADRAYFAPESLSDPAGRRILWTWLLDQRSAEVRRGSGSSGELSLPRVVWLGDDGTLRMQPAEEFKRLRINPVKLPDQLITPNCDVPVPTASTNSLEISVRFHIGDSTKCGVRVACSPGGDEQTLVYYDSANRALVIDTSRSSLSDGEKVLESAPFELASGEALDLRVFVDKSIVEAYANDRQAVVRRIYPSRQDSNGVALFTEGAPARATDITAWEIMPSNPF